MKGVLYLHNGPSMDVGQPSGGPTSHGVGTGSVGCGYGGLYAIKDGQQGAWRHGAPRLPRHPARQAAAVLAHKRTRPLWRAGVFSGGRGRGAGGGRDALADGSDGDARA